jgi:quinol monooxygenase YgiN
LAPQKICHQRKKGNVMSQNVKITAVLTAHAGKRDEIEAFLSEMAPHCRAEPGNLRWDVWRDRNDQHIYVIDELYADMDAVTDHRATPHFKAYLGRINDLARRTSLVLEPISVI